MSTESATPIWQVRIDTATGGVQIHTFDNEQEADDFADDYFTAMDTSDARETAVSVSKKAVL